jgi:putative DNA primase/helicase
MILHYQSGTFYAFQSATNSYREFENAVLRSEVYRYLNTAFTTREEPYNPTRKRVEDVVHAIQAVCTVPKEKAAPSWLTDFPDADPLDIMACRNGLLHIPTRTLLPSIPGAFFTLSGRDFDFDLAAPAPAHWNKFLTDLWSDDRQSIETLQEWFGYLLTHRTHFQKILMIVGPKRSGKGTIARVIKLLLGILNVCGPTLANMAEQFGLSGLIGKPAAIISDARIGGRTDTAIVTERLLSISGEDTLSIPRKFREDWTGKLPTRFTILTNELPRIEDSSGALSSRFIVLTLSESFFGREDHGLLDRFIPELPGILLWALDGLDRLQARERFDQPQSAADMIQQFEDLGSPINAFLRDRCEIGDAHSIACDVLYQSWISWCEDNGREKPGTKQTFGKSLRAAVTRITQSQSRDGDSRIRYYNGVRLK